MASVSQTTSWSRLLFNSKAYLNLLEAMRIYPLLGKYYSV